MADADEHASPEVIERRRQGDLDFLYLVKTGGKEELLKLREKAKGWRLIAIDRRLRQFG